MNYPCAQCPVRGVIGECLAANCPRHAIMSAALNRIAASAADDSREHSMQEVPTNAPNQAMARPAEKQKREMSSPVKVFLWMVATVSLTFIAALLLHPAVIIGTMIGVAMTTLKNIHPGE